LPRALFGFLSREFCSRARSLARIRFSLKLVALHTVLGGNWVLAQWWFRLMGCEKQSNFFVVWFFSPEMKCDRKWKKEKKEEREEEYINGTWKRLVLEFNDIGQLLRRVDVLLQSQQVCDG